MKTNQDSLLFRFAFNSLKYFLLALMGLAIAYVISACFGALNIALMLLPIVIDIVGRLGIIVFCAIAITIIIESLR
jgi:Na+/H+ antiporter NhaD/arsenite permease-like protein